MIVDRIFYLLRALMIKTELFFKKNITWPGFRCGRVLIEFNNTADVEIAKSAYFSENCCLRVRENAKLEIGKNVFLNNNCMITCRKAVTIGDNSIFGPGVVIFDHDHDYTKANFHSKYRSDSISIGKNVWIGANVVILKGSIIEDEAVIAAGTIVRGNVSKCTMFYNKNTNYYKKIVRGDALEETTAFQ